MKKQTLRFTNHSIERFFERVNNEYLRNNDVTINDDFYKVRNRLKKVLKAGTEDKSFLNDKLFLGKLYDKHGYNKEFSFIYNKECGIVFLIMKNGNKDVVLTVLKKEMTKINSINKYSHIPKKEKTFTQLPESIIETNLPSVVQFLEVKNIINNTKPIENNLLQNKLSGEQILNAKIKEKLASTRGVFLNKIRPIYIHYEEKEEIIIYYKNYKKDKFIYLHQAYQAVQIFDSISFEHQVPFNAYLESLTVFDGKNIMICVDTINNKAFFLNKQLNGYHLQKAYNLVPKTIKLK